MVVKKKKKLKNKKSSGGSDIMKRVKPVQEVEQYSAALYYGRSGTGKTTLASTYPKDILLLDFKDRGVDSVRDVEGLDILTINEWDDVEDIYWAISKDQADYKSLILDTVSGMQSMAIRRVKEDHRLDDTDSLSRKGWGEVSGLMDTWLMNFRDLPMHVVFLAPDRTKNTSDEDEEVAPEEGRLEPEVGPALTPSVARSLNAAVNIIGNTFIRQRRAVKKGKPVEITGYMLRIGPHPYYITKIRSPKKFETPGSILNPSYEKINKIMKGEK